VSEWQVIAVVFLSGGLLWWLFGGRPSGGNAVGTDTESFLQQAENDAAASAAGASPARSGRDDHDFLLAKCEGDEAELQRRLEAEVRRNPNLPEDQVYRRAIRSWFQEKRGGTHGDVGGESNSDDIWL